MLSKGVLGCAQSRAEPLDRAGFQGEHLFSFSCIPPPQQAPKPAATTGKKCRKCPSLGNFMLTMPINGKILNQSYSHREPKGSGCLFISLLLIKPNSLLKIVLVPYANRRGNDAAGGEWDWKMSDLEIISPSATRFGEAPRSLLCHMKPQRYRTLLPGDICYCLWDATPVAITLEGSQPSASPALHVERWLTWVADSVWPEVSYSFLLLGHRRTNTSLLKRVPDTSLPPILLPSRNLPQRNGFSSLVVQWLRPTIRLGTTGAFMQTFLGPKPQIVPGLTWWQSPEELIKWI